MFLDSENTVLERFRGVELSYFAVKLNLRRQLSSF